MASPPAAPPEVKLSPASERDAKTSPDAALDELIAGNRRFISGRTMSHRRDLMILQQMMEKQEPFAAILSCADSRVPVEVVFDQTIGQLFVTRVAGNMVTPEILASLEYAAAVLGTHTILVMGHSRCGAITAAIQAGNAGGSPAPGRIGALFPYLEAAVKQAAPDVDATVRANALLQAADLRRSSQLLSGLVEEGKLKIAAGYFDLGSGTVTLLDE
ncbi:MAG: carbonic anhydrase [Acidobacteriaceae bacterium]